MKFFYLFAVLTLTNIFASAQLVNCRPKICLIDYNWHNDHSSNADMIAIQTAKPEILIDNTPGGFWGPLTGTACLPSKYTPLGIQVFSYIVGGYEGVKYGGDTCSLASNLARIEAIAKDSATGVFLDEVSHHPTTSKKNYISSIYNKCKEKGLKLIINPGVSNFDPWLMDNCDFLMSDEQYNGKRTLTASETPFASRILVVAQDVTSAADAAAITLGARSNGFGYSYACNLYILMPTWLNNYLTLVTKKPTTPSISLKGKTLESIAPYGNQWYEKTQGILTGANNQLYTPTANGVYYSILTLDGCGSDTSNFITVSLSGINLIKNTKPFNFYPNPASDFILLNLDQTTFENLTLNIYNTIGVLVKSEKLYQKKQQISLRDLSTGVYMMKINSEFYTGCERLIIQK